ncbi:MAG: hypothetical protein ACI8PZ_002630 [Myxococcota bacterium]|jgi:hypothetical protein
MTHDDELPPGGRLERPEPGELVVLPRIRAGAHTRTLHALDTGRGVLDAIRQRGPASRVEVHDPTLTSPVAVHRLYCLLRQLAQGGVLGSDTALTVQTLESRSDRTPHWVSDDWACCTRQAAVLRSLLARLSNTVQLLTRPRDRGRRQARRIAIAGAGGQVELRLDDGFSVPDPGRVPFPFAALPNAQLGVLMRGGWVIEARQHCAPALRVVS